LNKRKNINFRSGIKKHDLVPVNIFLGLTCIIAQFYLTKEATDAAAKATDAVKKATEGLKGILPGNK
jgi:hypothetical protein